KDGAGLRAQRHHEHRFGFAKAGEIEKPAVPTVVVMRVGITMPFGRRRHDDEPGSEGLRELRAAFAEVLDGYGGLEFPGGILTPGRGRMLPHEGSDGHLAVALERVRHALRVLARPVLRELELALDPLDREREPGDGADEVIDEVRRRLVDP